MQNGGFPLFSKLLMIMRCLLYGFSGMVLVQIMVCFLDLLPQFMGTGYFGNDCCHHNFIMLHFS